MSCQKCGGEHSAMDCDDMLDAPKQQTASSLAGPPGSVPGCDHCDTFGGVKTYENQACLPLNGRVVCVDWCIHHIVAALNAGGIQTTASCCGHGRLPGRIDLADGRILRIENEIKA